MCLKDPSSRVVLPPYGIVLNLAGSYLMQCPRILTIVGPKTTVPHRYVFALFALVPASS